MEERALGRSGLRVSRLGLGTMTWGQDTDTEDATAQLTAFRDQGGTLVDTADVFAGGASERVLGQLLANHRDGIRCAHDRHLSATSTTMVSCAHADARWRSALAATYGKPIKPDSQAYCR